MAKSTIKKEDKKTSTNENIVKTNEENKAIESPTELSLIELVYAEQATSAICKKYENSIKNYDGSIIRGGTDYAKFTTFNNMHNNIISKLENILLKLNI